MIHAHSPASAGLYFFSKAFAIAVACALAASCAACGPRSNDDEISIISYNAMALFDGKDDGLEYSGYRVANGEWNPELYRERLANLKRVLLSETQAGPDIACLVEIENGGVVSDLRGLMPASEYAFEGFAGGDTSTGCGILSRLPIVGMKSHRPSIGGQAFPFRPILEAQIDADGTRLFVFVNHWKSKSEGEEATENFRVASAELLAQLMIERMTAYPDALFIACGDMNEEADEWETSEYSYATALGILDSEGGGYKPQNGAPIVLTDRAYGGSTLGTRSVPGGRLGKEGMLLVSPWLFTKNAGEWSYWWDRRGEQIDHFFLCPSLFDGQAWDFAEFHVMKDDILLDLEDRPLAWNTDKRKGFSDHLPLWIKIKRIE